MQEAEKRSQGRSGWAVRVTGDVQMGRGGRAGWEAVWRHGGLSGEASTFLSPVLCARHPAKPFT